MNEFNEPVKKKKKKNMKVPSHRKTVSLQHQDQKPGGQIRKQKDNGESLLQAPRTAPNSRTSQEEVRIGDEHGMEGKRSQTGQCVGAS